MGSEDILIQTILETNSSKKCVFAQIPLNITWISTMPSGLDYNNDRRLIQEHSQGKKFRVPAIVLEFLNIYSKKNG